LANLGDWLYDQAIDFSAFVSKVRKKLGYKHWSLSKWAKAQVKSAVTFLEGYEDLMKEEAAKYSCVGTISGHIHTASINESDGYIYINCGDWVESFTAIAEKYDGTFEVITWMEDK
jgi:UDP-2,3-diacylglucosamine pyrophosphatase LpxH